jgi:hypothetical protein
MAEAMRVRIRSANGVVALGRTLGGDDLPGLIRYAIRKRERELARDLAIQPGGPFRMDYPLLVWLSESCLLYPDGEGDPTYIVTEAECT